ncbi:sodium/hydrogen exchanger 9B2-like [Liolophura sinensis]|uniref:sodium/hydrogen exchanger 9B2-like n=1 Tax=Liolophura sinensis TaxID=3198878 RepID=UPI00315824CA
MLIMGGMLRNLPKVNVAEDIDPNWSTCIRSAALVVILLRAGLGLDPSSLRKLSFVVLRLAFTPCIVEGAAIAVAAYLILGFPWAWGALQGLVIGAVTPAVVVPCILSLSDRGYGVHKGIPTLVIAASSIDDVLAITGFSLTLGFVFGRSDNLADTITKGPREVLLGMLLGIVYGLLLWYLPPRKTRNKRWFRFGLLFIGGLVFMFGGEKADFPSAGPIGCLTLAFVAAYRWRIDNIEEAEDMDELMEKVWNIAEPFMFGLIGAEIDVSTLDPPTVGLGVAVLGIGLVFRMLTSFLAVSGTDLTMKERLFIVFAWLPKATVQAAIGPVAYDTAVRSEGTYQEKQMGLQILTLAVMSIILTAPIGGALILLTGPKLLSKEPIEDVSSMTYEKKNMAEKL